MAFPKAKLSINTKPPGSGVTTIDPISPTLETPINVVIKVSASVLKLVESNKSPFEAKTSTVAGSPPKPMDKLSPTALTSGSKVAIKASSNSLTAKMSEGNPKASKSRSTIAISESVPVDAEVKNSSGAHGCGEGWMMSSAGAISSKSRRVRPGFSESN